MSKERIDNMKQLWTPERIAYSEDNHPSENNLSNGFSHYETSKLKTIQEIAK